MIHLKSPNEVATMHEGGKILAKILKKLAEAVRPGITTLDLDKLARELILFYKVKSAFLNYEGYPAAICTSVNDEVVHCVPSERKLKEGEIISLDMGITFKGFNLDAALTLPVLNKSLEIGFPKVDSYKKWAESNPKLHKLIETTKKALNAGIKQAKAGNRIGKISHAIQTVVEKNGFNVVRDLVGHGIGRELHEEPQVPNFGLPNESIKLQEGMVVAIEPMVIAGDWHLVKGKDGFSYNTADGFPAAHFEHTVAITKNGPLVLTLL